VRYGVLTLRGFLGVRVLVGEADPEVRPFTDRDCQADESIADDDGFDIRQPLLHATIPGV
jgi:hypothetical protein